MQMELVFKELPERDAPSGMTWETWTGWVTVYHTEEDGYWVEPDMRQGSPLGLTYGQAVAWVKKHYPASKPLAKKER